MKPETTKHLEEIEGVMRRAKLILAPGTGYPDDLRTVIVIGTITQIIEHHSDAAVNSQRQGWFIVCIGA